MAKKPWKTASLLEGTQELFRQAREGLTLDEIMRLLESPVCEHGVKAESCWQLCEAPGRLESRQFAPCRKAHGPYLRRQRPKWVRGKLEELIGLGLMHKEVSPHGFRYQAHEKLFALFHGPAPLPEHLSLIQRIYADREKGDVWFSADPQAPQQVRAAREAEFHAAYQREKERAKALMLAGKMVCPFCKGTRHEVSSPDYGTSSNLGFAKCLPCDRHFHFSLSGEEVVRTQGDFHCQWHPGEGYHRFSASCAEELLSRGWRRFPGMDDRWVCNECLAPERQQARRAERLAKKTARVVDGLLHCPFCNGTEYRLAGRKHSPDFIEYQHAEYGENLCNEVTAKCLNPNCFWQVRIRGVPPSKRPNWFDLPPGHRWRACSCGKHAEIPAGQNATQCTCGQTLWLRWEDGRDSDASKQPATSGNAEAKRDRNEQSEKARTRISPAERRRAFRRSLELAAALVQASKIACPFCSGRDHKLGMGDSHATGGAPCSVSINCRACESLFYAIISTGNGELLKVARSFDCVTHPEFACSSPGSRRSLDHPGDDYCYQDTEDEAVANGWRSFQGISKDGPIQWICPDCRRPDRSHQDVRRRERGKRTGRFIHGRLHCAGCNGTNVRIESGLLRNREYIEKEIALYGAYLYDEVYGVCLEQWGHGGDDGGCPLTHLPMFGRRKLFHLPDGHRWRACACGGHREIPEGERATQCACGQTLWLNYEDRAEWHSSGRS